MQDQDALYWCSQCCGYVLTPAWGGFDGRHPVCPLCGEEIADVGEDLDLDVLDPDVLA